MANRERDKVIRQITSEVTNYAGEVKDKISDKVLQVAGLQEDKKA